MSFIYSSSLVLNQCYLDYWENDSSFGSRELLIQICSIAVVTWDPWLTSLSIWNKLSFFPWLVTVRHHNILQVVQLTKFDYRLANNLDEELQKLRCRVNYHALRFTKPIRDLGQKLVSRMRKMTNRFIAVHLRFVISTWKNWKNELYLLGWSSSDVGYNSIRTIIQSLFSSIQTSGNLYSIMFILPFWTIIC